MADDRMSLVCTTCRHAGEPNAEFLFAKSLGGKWYESNGFFRDEKFAAFNGIEGYIEACLYSWLEEHFHGDSGPHFTLQFESQRIPAVEDTSLSTNFRLKL